MSNSPKPRLLIGVAQLNPTVGDLRGNSQLIFEASKWAARRGADLLVTPELSLCGYPPRDLLMDGQFVQAMAQALEHLSKRLAHEVSATLAVLVGTVCSNPLASKCGGKPLFNSAALLRGGQVEQVFHKRLLPTYDVFDEDRYFEAGSNSSFFVLHGVCIGVTICEDIWNDEKFWGKRNYGADPVAELAETPVDLLVNMSASPFAVGKIALRQAMLRHSAIAHDLPVIYVNQVGGNDDLIFDGSSIALNRHGQVIGQLPSFQSAQQVWQFDCHGGDLVPCCVPPPSEPMEQQVWSALVLGVRDYAHKCGFRKAVIGLSGGIDSALVAAIATEALGGDMVLGVMMPSPYSSAHSITDAQQLAQNLGIATALIPIAPIMSAFDQSLAGLFAGKPADVTEENLQSRIRGTLLMAISNKFGYLLLSTGNKSEMAVGYCTLYGDMNGGLAVIADVPKTMVYSLCKWLNSQRGEVIPKPILHKPPSAELRPNQVDQDSLPPYEILDDILQKRIGEYASGEEIVAAGHDPDTVSKVLRLIKSAEFKRRQAPPGLKISDRAFGSGWRMPIACKLA
jgi:NAD+ synthetase